MNRIFKYHTFKESGISRLWVTVRRIMALTAVVFVLTVGMTACSLDDLLMPMGGEIPYEQQQTTPPDAGWADRTPTVPDDSSFDDNDFRPV